MAPTPQDEPFITTMHHLCEERLDDPAFLAWLDRQDAWLDHQDDADTCPC